MSHSPSEEEEEPGPLETVTVVDHGWCGSGAGDTAPPAVDAAAPDGDDDRIVRRNFPLFFCVMLTRPSVQPNSTPVAAMPLTAPLTLPQSRHQEAPHIHGLCGQLSRAVVCGQLTPLLYTAVPMHCLCLCAVNAPCRSAAPAPCDAVKLLGSRRRWRESDGQRPRGVARGTRHP